MADIEKGPDQEHLNQPEQAPERLHSAEQLAALEKAGEAAEAKQTEALEQARHHVEHSAKQPHHSPERAKARHQAPTRSEKKAIYKQTLKHIQKDLPKTERRFSQLVHQPAIEKASEISGKTFFRPSITLGASLGVLIGGGILYLAAKRYGFELSGSEFIILAVGGGLLGLLFELGWVGLRKLLKKDTGSTA